MNELRVNGNGSAPHAADDVEAAIAEVMKLPAAVPVPIDARDLAQLVADAGAYRDNAIGSIMAANARVQSRAKDFAAHTEAFCTNLQKQFDAFATCAVDLDDSMRAASEVVEAQRLRLEGAAE